LFKIAPLLPPISPIKIIDVGAMTLDEVGDPYAALAAGAPIEVVGFEPAEAELAKLRAANVKGRTYLPFIVGDGQRQTFYECNFAMTSSIFRPNTALVSKFQSLGEVMQVVRTSEMSTVRLDDVPECAGADFIKVDTQGAELMILEGAENLLQQAQVVEVEVEFIQLYEGQPVFADLDSYLRARGFQFHKFSAIHGRTFKPLVANHNMSAMMSQALWSDGIYVKDFMRFSDLSVEQLLKIAVIMHEHYRSYDMASLALAAVDERQTLGVHGRYLQSLAGGPRPSWG
jgi:FkbM family methyltransferase